MSGTIVGPKAATVAQLSSTAVEKLLISDREINRIAEQFIPARVKAPLTTTIVTRGHNRTRSHSAPVQPVAEPVTSTKTRPQTVGTDLLTQASQIRSNHQYFALIKRVREYIANYRKKQHKKFKDPGYKLLPALMLLDALIKQNAEQVTRLIDLMSRKSDGQYYCALTEGKGVLFDSGLFKIYRDSVRAVNNYSKGEIFNHKWTFAHALWGVFIRHRNPAYNVFTLNNMGNGKGNILLTRKFLNREEDKAILAKFQPRAIATYVTDWEDSGVEAPFKSHTLQPSQIQTTARTHYQKDLSKDVVTAACVLQETTKLRVHGLPKSRTNQDITAVIIANEEKPKLVQIVFPRTDHKTITATKESSNKKNDTVMNTGGAGQGHGQGAEGEANASLNKSSAEKNSYEEYIEKQARLLHLFVTIAENDDNSISHCKAGRGRSLALVLALVAVNNIFTYRNEDIRSHFLNDKNAVKQAVKQAFHTASTTRHVSHTKAKQDNAVAIVLKYGSLFHKPKSWSPADSKEIDESQLSEEQKARRAQREKWMKLAEEANNSEAAVLTAAPVLATA